MRLFFILYTKSSKFGVNFTVKACFTLKYSHLKYFSGYFVGHRISSLSKVENVRLASFPLPYTHRKFYTIIIEEKDRASLISAS